jgi:hypothetical protein
MADSKGRLHVLYMSLAIGAFFTLAFGLSNNYFVALAARFLLGLFCDIGAITKVCVSELAGDDRELEAKSMNLVVSSWAMATLLSPAIGGALADPVKQFPSSFILQSTFIHDLLLRYRYFLPNFIGAMLCLMGIPIVKLNLRETLEVMQHSDDTRAASEQDPLLTSPDLDDDLYVLSPEAIEVANAENEEAMVARDAYLYSSDFDGLMATAQSRNAIYHKSKQTNNLQNKTDPPSIKSLFENAEQRNHLIVFCLGLFLVQFHMEAFPLFCLSKDAGLGVSESTIGGIMMVSGIIHALVQPPIYSYLFARRGLKGSIKWTAATVAPVFFIIPFSRLSRGVGSDQLRWTALTFLGVVIGLGRVFTVTFASSMLCSLNQLVPSKHRATFNGLLTWITAKVKGVAPVAAGLFTSWAFTSGVVVAQEWGAVLIYASLGMIAILLAVASFMLLGQDEFL